MGLKKLIKEIIVFAAVIVTAVSITPKSVFAKDKITIVIDPGHGGPKDTDADHGAIYNGIKEKDIDLKTAMALYSELSQYGNVNVYMTRVDDSEVDLKRRASMASSVKADAMICVHYNASADHLFYGGEAFIPSKGSLYASGYGLANTILNVWSNNGIVNKGVKTRIGKNGDYYGVIRHGASMGVPVIILEHSYMDNYHDIKNVDDDSDYLRFAKMDAEGIAKYFGLEKGVQKKSVGPTVNVKVPNGVVRDDTTGPVNVSLCINSYNKAEGKVTYTMYANEPESKVMYYGLSLVPKLDSTGKVVPLLTDLILWGNGNKVEGSFTVPKGYTGAIYGICYNNFNQPSETVMGVIN